MPVPAALAELVERFSSHRDSYRSGHYNEAQLRREFLDPFLETLGWDVYNRKGYAEAYKEVIHEDAIKIGGRTKAPDYSLRAGGGQRSLFVEAKKPSVDIREATSPAYQLRRYSWSAKLPVGILTDFEELAVYDCRIRPEKTDRAATARLLFLEFTQYEERWEELSGLFSPEAVRRGSLEKLVAANKVKKGTAEVDAAFLGEIEAWREVLARNIALRNPGIGVRDLNFAVQRIIDRIVFLRICEDRGIEPYGRLHSAANGAEIYRRLAELFQRADERYNSGLFHFTPERDRREPPDELTLALHVDDKPLKEIIHGLYFPDSPYEFSVLPAEILGQVYEQFLGKVVRLTKGGQAKVEEKPEVRKAGGVYYTPAYIVDYIVRQTVGKLLEGRTPRQVERQGLRVVDPACGSGSFLIGAYQYLLDWHRDRYLEDDPEQHARGRRPRVYRSASGVWRLTTAEKKRILLEHIYGVDIDPQAVEVTKLSLLLKVLEGESEETVGNQLRLFHERALPDLGANIKCGNSLVGPDFYEGRQMGLFDPEEVYRINAFDWKAEFSQVFSGKDAGFDAVIGNPPYVRQEGVSEHKDYFSKRYHAYHGLADLYVYFYEKGLNLVRPGGVLGFITSSKFIHAGYGGNLRTLLGTTCRLRELLDYGDHQIFQGATTYPVITIAASDSVAADATLLYARCTDESGLVPAAIAAHGQQVPLRSLAGDRWVLTSESCQRLLLKIREQSLPLQSVAGPAQLGIKTSLNEAFVVDGRTAENLLIEDPRATNVIKPYGRGRDLAKWHAMSNGSFLVCTRVALDLSDYPGVKKHLVQFESKLRARYEVRRGDYQWWVVRQVADTAIFDNPKIVYPDLCSRPTFALNCDGMYPNNTVFCLASANPSLLAYLNSPLAWFWVTHNCPANRGRAYRLFNQYMDQLPVHRSIPDDPQLSELGTRMIGLSQRLLGAKTDHDKTVLMRQIEATDRQIDRLVYELYGLTVEEIALVEGATKT